ASGSARRARGTTDRAIVESSSKRAMPPAVREHPGGRHRKELASDATRTISTPPSRGRGVNADEAQGCRGSGARPPPARRARRRAAIHAGGYIPDNRGGAAVTGRRQRNDTPARTGWRVTPEEVADTLAGLEAGFADRDDPAGPSVAVVLGAGAKVRVERGHLVASDGVGRFRRERRWNRATGRLRRLVVGASSGYLSIDAISWCQAAGVAVVVVDSDGEVMLAP